MTWMTDADGRHINVDALRERVLIVTPDLDRRAPRVTVDLECEQHSFTWETRGAAERFIALLADANADDQPSMFTPQLVPSEQATARQMHDHIAAGGVL